MEATESDLTSGRGPRSPGRDEMGLGARASRSSPLRDQDGDGTWVGFDRRLWSPGRDGATVVADRDSVSEEEIAAALMAIHILRQRTAPALGGVESAWRRAARVEAIGGASTGWRSGGWGR